MVKYMHGLDKKYPNVGFGWFGMVLELLPVTFSKIYLIFNA